MKRNIFVEVFFDFIDAFVYFIKSNLMNFASLLNVLLPYAMYLIGQYVCEKRNGFIIGFELLIPIVVFIIIYVIKSCANKIGKGVTVPIPDKRFTQVDEDGEVNVEYERVQELILYVADVEDWLEKKGLL